MGSIDRQSRSAVDVLDSTYRLFCKLLEKDLPIGEKVILLTQQRCRSRRYTVYEKLESDMIRGNLDINRRICLNLAGLHYIICMIFGQNLL